MAKGDSFSLGLSAWAGMNDVRDMFPRAIRPLAGVQPRAFISGNVRGLLRPAFPNCVESIRLRIIPCGRKHGTARGCDGKTCLPCRGLPAG